MEKKMENEMETGLYIILISSHLDFKPVGFSTSSDVNHGVSQRFCVPACSWWSKRHHGGDAAMGLL